MILFFWSFAFLGFLLVWAVVVYSGFQFSKRIGWWSMLAPPFSLYVAWKKSRLLFVFYTVVIAFVGSATFNLIQFAGLPKSATKFVLQSRDAKIQYDLSFLENSGGHRVEKLFESLDQGSSWVKNVNSVYVAYTYKLKHESVNFGKSGYLEGTLDGQPVKALGMISKGRAKGYGSLEKRLTRTPFAVGLQTVFLTLEERDGGYLSYLIIELPSDIFLEVYEWNASKERPLTQILIDKMSKNFQQRASSIP